MSRSKSLSVFNLTKKCLYEYDTVWKWQKALQHQIHKHRTGGHQSSPWLTGDALILCEHPPTYTLGKSAVYSGSPPCSKEAGDNGLLNGIEADNLCQKSLRDDLGDRRTSQDTLRTTVVMRKIERGGDITFHGPGQLVMYPILDLSKPKKGHGDHTLKANPRFRYEDLRWYVSALEQSLICTVDDFVRPHARGLGTEAIAMRSAVNPGVWLRDSQPGTHTSRMAGSGGVDHSSMSKIGAIGISASRWVCMHGASLNVTFDQAHIRQHYYDRIVACGITDPTHKGVTSLLLTMQHYASSSTVAAPTVATAADSFLQKFIQELEYDPRQVSIYTDDRGDGADGVAVGMLDRVVEDCVRQGL